MYKHILIPTDGSPHSARAVKAGIALAKEAGAKVTGYHAIDPIPLRLYGEGYMADKAIVAQFEKRNHDWAKKQVAGVARAARKAGVRFEVATQTARTPYEGIVETAQKRGCDLIFMGSQGRRGLMRFAVGSVADKVIQLSKVPVLVYK